MELLAHRGESYIAPENTLAAINLAWEKGATAVEIDVYLTSDQKIILSHDKSTARCSGTDLLVPETSSEELRKLDVGKWKGDEYAGEKMPFLSEVLATIPEGGKILIEVKCGPEILPLLRDTIYASGKRAQVVVIIFNLDVVTECKKLMPDVVAYWLQTTKKDPETGNWLSYDEDHLIKTTLTNKLDGLDLYYPMVTKEFASAIKSAGLAVWTWTVNDPVEARNQAEIGVEGMATDRCAWINEQIS